LQESPLKESLQEHVDDVEVIARERLQKVSATFYWRSGPSPPWSRGSAWMRDCRAGLRGPALVFPPTRGWGRERAP